jgi:hypothetical protein
MMLRIVQEPVPDLRGEGLPDEVAAVLETAMAKTPAQRFASAEDFGEQLRRAQIAMGLPATSMVVHGPVEGRLELSPGGAAGDDDEGLTRHRLRPVVAPPVPAPLQAPGSASSRPKVIAAAAVAACIVLLAGFLLTRGGDAPSELAAGAEPGEPESVTLDLGLIQSRSSALQVRRVWTLSGDDGSEFTSVVTVTNPGAEPVAFHDEVIPKELAETVVDVDFEPAFTEVIEADPVVRYQIDLAPGASFELTYAIEVPAEGVTEKRLRRFQRAQLLAQNVYDKVPEDAPAQVLEEGEVTVVDGDDGQLASGSGGSASGGSPGATGGVSAGDVTPTGGGGDIGGGGSNTTPTGGGGSTGGSGSDTTIGGGGGGTDPTPVPSTPPATPTGVTCTPGQGQMQVSWNAVAGAALYRVDESGAVSAAAERTATNATITGLDPNSTHGYDVTALKSDGLESGRASCSGKVPLPPAPGAPNQVSATGGQNKQVPLSWTAVAGAARYRVFTAGGSAIINDVGGTSYTVVDGGLGPCTSVSYLVSAVDAYGQEGPTRASNAVTSGQAGGPSIAHNASYTMYNNTQITVQSSSQTNPSDPDGAADSLSYILKDLNFDGGNFNFAWNTGGTYTIKAPAGFVGQRWLKFAVRDRCGVESNTVQITMNFVNRP